MAALLEGIAFSPISNELDLLAVTDKDSKAEVIVTNRRKTFEIYKLSDRKPLKSWAVRHGVTLTSPVIGWTDNEQDRFITVTNNQDVRLWNGDTFDFEKAKRKHSASKIHQIFVAAGLSPIILYECGATGFLSHIKDAPEKGCVQEGDTIRWCGTHEKERQLHVIFVAQSKARIKLFVSTYDQDSDSWSQHESDVTPPSNNAELCSCDGYRSADSVSMYFLWSNGVLTKVSFDNGQVNDSCHTQTVPRAGKDSALVMLDGTHAAITGIIQNGQAGISVFNVKFGIQQAWQPFSEKPRSKHKVFCVQNYIFVPCGRMLYAYKFECQASSVASLLGQGSSTPVSSRVSGNFKWTAHGNNHCKTSESSKYVMDLFQKASNPSLSYDRFKTAFENLMEQLKPPHMKHWLMGTQMVHLLKQLFSQTKFWPQTELAELISIGCIPHSMTDAVIDSLIQHTEVALVHQMMSTVLNITERALCKALAFYLSCEESKLQSAVDNDVSMEEEDGEDTPTETTCPLSLHRVLLVNKILQMPYSDVFLLESLRHTTFKHALTLVEYLSSLLKTQPAARKTSDDQTKPNTLTMLQILDWLSLVLDAHMTQFVLSPDSHVTLVNLRTFVATQVEFQSSLDSFETLLEQIMAKTSCTQKARVGTYCIETLRIL